MRRIGILACLVLALDQSVIRPCSAQGGSAHNVELTDALVAYDREEFSLAFRLFLALAQRNVPLAQMFVGRLFADGIGTSQNCELAVLWLTRAAQGGIPDAASDLASFSEQGRCLPRKMSQAIYWYIVAANLGDAQAPNAIGEIYLGRSDVAPDVRKAIFWFERAAMLFDGRAYYHLGEIYAGGQGVLKDLIEAYKWFDLAANFSAAEQVGQETEGTLERDRIREELMPPEVAEGKKRAADFQAQAIMQLDGRPMRWQELSAAIAPGGGDGLQNSGDGGEPPVHRASRILGPSSRPR